MDISATEVGEPVQLVTDVARVVDGPVLWHCGYWDGPLSGVVLIEERLCWFQHHGDELADHRDYLVYDLTDEEARHVVTEHLLFEQYVGVHTCNHVTLDGKRQVGLLHPQEGWGRFYQRPEGRKDRDYTEGKTPIGRLA